jgi:hypothetical protein
MKCKAYSVGFLLDRTIHPEVGANNFDRVRYAVRCNRLMAAITHEAEVLGFLCAEIPDTVPIASQEAAFIRPFLKPTNLRKLENEGAVRLRRNTRPCAWYVPAKHWPLLPLTVFGGSN